MTGGESGDENVGFDTGYDVFLRLAVDRFQDIVIANAESGQFNRRIMEDVLQIHWVLNLFRLGFVGSFPKFAPKTIQHQFGHLLATRIFFNERRVQLNPLSFPILLHVPRFVLGGNAPARPTRRLLFNF